MAAVATKKPGGDFGVQVGFPAVFQQYFTAGVAYYPDEVSAPFEMLVGTTFQSANHEQKRLEANQNVLNGLQARRSAELKLLTGPHNYHVPKPVLGQRRFANPSYGAWAGGESTRRDNASTAPWRTVESDTAYNGIMLDGQMHGGVVRTREGYDFYKGQLNDRINQLNAMNSLAQGWAVPLGQSEGTMDNTKIGSTNKVEFFVMLRALMDAVTAGDLTRFTYENIKDMLGKMFYFGPTASQDDFEDMFHAMDSIVRDIQQGMDTTEGNSMYSDFQNPQYATTLLLFMRMARSYAGQMFKNMNMSEKDRTTLSKSLVKSLGFERLLRNQTPAGVVNDARTVNSRVSQAAQDFDDFDEGGWGDGRFDQPAPNREDEEQSGMVRAPFAGEGGDPNREAWGARRGAYNQPAAYFDVEPLANPLNYGGPDATTAAAPPQDIGEIQSATSDAIDRVLDQFGGGGGTREQKVAANFPQEETFVEQVASALEEQGFSNAQIAAGMDAQPDLQDVFATYVAENSGDLAPPPIPGAVYDPTVGVMGAPVFPGTAAAAAGPDVAVPLPRGFRQHIPSLAADATRRQAAAAAVAPRAPHYAPAPHGPPSVASASSAAKREFHYPSTRAKLRDKLRTVAEAQAFAATIPKEYGTYKPRTGSHLTNIISTIIRMIRKHNPNY